MFVRLCPLSKLFGPLRISELVLKSQQNINCYNKPKPKYNLARSLANRPSKYKYQITKQLQQIPKSLIANQQYKKKPLYIKTPIFNVI